MNSWVWSHRTQWKKHCTHSSFSQSVVSETDQCDQCDSVIEGNKKCLFTNVSNCSDWQPWKKQKIFICQLSTGVGEIKKKIFSPFLMERKCVTGEDESVAPSVDENIYWTVTWCHKTQRFSFILYWVFKGERFLNKAFLSSYHLIQTALQTTWLVMNDHAKKWMHSRWHRKALWTFTKNMVYAQKELNLENVDTFILKGGEVFVLLWDSVQDLL